MPTDITAGTGHQNSLLSHGRNPFQRLAIAYILSANQRYPENPKNTLQFITLLAQRINTINHVSNRARPQLRQNLKVLTLANVLSKVEGSG